MIDARLIILMSVLGILIVLIWWAYRLSTFRRKRRKIELLSQDIGKMYADGVKNAHAQSRTGPEIPEGNLLVLFHHGNRSPWKRTFNRALKHQGHGMVVSTSNPEEVKSQYKGDIRIVWLNRSTAAKTRRSVVVVNPTNLSGVINEVDTFFVEGERKGVILLDGFEDILRSNDASRVIRFLNAMRDRCAGNDLSLIAPLSYKAVPQRVRSQIEESFDTVVI